MARISKPSPAMLVALSALFVALGGGAYASVTANQVKSVHIKNGEVKNVDLAAAFGSIHRIGAIAADAPACNGWTFWSLETKQGPKPIDLFRREIRRQMALGA